MNSVGDAALNSPGEESTSPSLLDGLREEDADAWNRFARIWSPLIYQRCRRLGCHGEAARDISQNVLLSVLKGLAGFRRDGKSFRLRHWVQGIVRRQIANYYRQEQGHSPVGGSDFQVVLANLPAEGEESSVDWFAPAQILARALDVVENDVEPHNWQAFRMIYFEGFSAKEAAESLGSTPGAVRQATLRIRKKLEAEVDAMLD